MKIRILRPFTGTPGGEEKAFAAGQEIAVPAGLDRKTAALYVNQKRAAWVRAKRQNKEK